MTEIVPIEDRIKAREDLSEEEKSAAIRAIQELTSEVYSEAFMKSILSRVDEVDNREPTAKASELARLEAKFDVVFSELKTDLKWIKWIGSVIIAINLIPWLENFFGGP